MLNEAKNKLEGAIYTTRNHIESAFDGHATQVELDSLNVLTKEVSQWYDDESYFAPRSVC